MGTDGLYLENLVKCRDAHRDLEETDQVNSCEICTRRWGGRPPNGKAGIVKRVIRLLKCGNRMSHIYFESRPCILRSFRAEDS